MPLDVVLTVMFMSGPDDGAHFDLTGSDASEELLTQGILHQYTIGRRESCDICIPYDTSVSRLHGWIHVREDGLWLVDNDSRNGMFLGNNTKRIILPTAIRFGQLFRAANTYLRVQHPDDDEGSIS
jgi:pSer/pThr/pTyr-binding forkhead associated (FHA) protein